MISKLKSQGMEEEEGGGYVSIYALRKRWEIAQSIKASARLRFYARDTEHYLNSYGQAVSAASPTLC